MEEQHLSVSLGPVHKTTLVESVMEQIIRLMRNGRLQPGDKLPSERALMTMLNVGRSTVREALQGLVALNLIETRSGHGSHVKTIPPLTNEPAEVPFASSLQREMRLQLLDMRQIVESAVGLWAIERATDEDIETLREHLEAYIRYTSLADWANSHVSHNSFHRGLAEASHNLIAVRVVDSLVATMPQSLMLKFVSLSQAIWEEERRIHQDIFRALEARDTQRMQAAIQEHMDAERRQIMSGH